MLLNKQKSYGQAYSQVKIKVKIDKRKFLGFIIIFLFLAEIVLGVLWASGR